MGRIKEEIEQSWIPVIRGLIKIKKQGKKRVDATK